jgi:hypothetical protein
MQSGHNTASASTHPNPIQLRTLSLPGAMANVQTPKGSKKASKIWSVSIDAISHIFRGVNLITTQISTSRHSSNDIVSCLAAVDKHMCDFQRFIENDKPRYQFSNYTEYATLGAAVSKLEEAITRFQSSRLPQESLAVGVTRATSSSTSISKAAQSVLAALKDKTNNHMEEMEKSTLDEEAKISANVAITNEVQTLLKQTTRVVEHVWRATDLLREYRQKRTQYKYWAWSATGTVMTATIAAVVGVIVAHLYGPAGMDLVSMSGSTPSMYSHILGLVERTQAVTNLRGEIYTMKLQNLEQRYNDLASLSESSGLRIDNLVDSLGPPNDHGTYYNSTKDDHKVCESRIRTIFDSLNRQLHRQHEEMEALRKNMNRMDIRLTRSIEKVRKG